MKPIRLTMKAFGSYAEETVVDFESFTGGLYLIVGKTGAGKTTIFDAISFALFGVPSGSERNVDMLHSDFVEKSEDTVVTLSFLHQGREYCVERSIHFAKKRGGLGYGEGKVSATMTWEQEAIEGASNVTTRCADLLGLTADQFRRIVMLAQGEFREFLKAGSDKKNEILGKLFDNSEYVRFQTLLSSASGKLSDQRKAYEAEIETVLRTLRLPEDEVSADYLAGNPYLLENLRALTTSDEQRLAQLQQESGERGQLVEALTRREGAAETDNALLEELEKKRALFGELEGRKEQIEVQAGEYAAAEQALHLVKPCADDLDRAEAAWQQTSYDIETKTTLLTEQQAALTKAQAAVEADGEKRAQLEALTAEATNLTATLPRYDEMDKLTGHLASAKKELSEAQSRAEELEEQRKTLADELAAVRVEIKALEGSDAETVRLERERDAAEERVLAVTEPKNGIAARTEAIQLEETEISTEIENLHKLTLKASAAEELYHTLYQSFLNGQAGLIAGEMERELAEIGRTVCPVCKSVFCRGDSHQFALPAERIPSKSEVDQAETAAKKTEQNRQKKKSSVETRQELLAQKKQSAVEAARKIDPGCDSWDVLSAQGYLPGLRDRLNSAFAEANESYLAAKKRSDRRKALLEQEPGKQSALEESGKNCEVVHGQIETLNLRIHGEERAINQLREELTYLNKSEAQERLNVLTEQKDALQMEIAAHEQVRSAAKEAVDGTEGGLRILQDKLPMQERAVADARTKLTKRLEEAGFCDLVAVAVALEPIGQNDGERWLTTRKQALDDYAYQLESTRSRIAELEKQTSGKKRIDLEALKAELLDAKNAQTAAANAVTEQRTICEGHKAVLRQVSAAKDSLAGTDRASKRISRLAMLAVGTNSEGGKLSFDRYVMGARFREVLDMANRRLDIMTGGRFELIHSVDAGRKNAVAGLEIEVLDRETGKQRSSSSVSGGEGFMVSLALALGLSDVVQYHAGGQKLDTLFIDEGFGTLDDGKLDNVITVLQQLTEGNRLVGVISHVDKLEESIPQKLRVSSGPHGSSLVLELS